MNLVLAAFRLLLLFACVGLTLTSKLQAPIDLHMTSVNFRYILSWQPGPDTPPGASYIVSCREQGKKKLQYQFNSTGTSLRLKLKKPSTPYQLEVQTTFNHTVSPAGMLFFTPCVHTVIGPPVVSLAGCGNCIQVNVSLPEPDQEAMVHDLYVLLDPSFKVYYKKKGGEKTTYLAKRRNFTLFNLQRSAEYCVQIQTLIRINNNTRTSDWTCVFSSSQQPSRALAMLLLTLLGLLVLVALMTFIICLHHTGFLCRLKALLPRALVPLLQQGYILTPKTILLDQVSIYPPSTTSSNGSCENLSELLRNESGQRLLEGPTEKAAPLDNYPTSLKGSLVCVSEEQQVEEKMQHDFSGDVDLFSVLTRCDHEKGEETVDEVGSACGEELYTDSSDCHLGDHPNDDQNGCGAQNKEDEEVEEEEEELSEYISHH